jgi:hypothetical protein
VAFQSTESLGLLKKATDRNLFPDSPAVVNAWYQPERNSITFPYAAFNPPYYKSVNFSVSDQVLFHLTNFLPFLPDSATRRPTTSPGKEVQPGMNLAMRLTMKVSIFSLGSCYKDYGHNRSAIRAKRKFI